MRSPLDIGISKFQKKRLPPAIRDILSDLSERRDILGAVLVKGDMGIVACDLPEVDHHTHDMPEILATLENCGAYSRKIPKNSLFPQLIRDGSEFKIFAKRMTRDLTLFVMLKSSGYIGLAAPDIEKTIKRIKKTL